MARGQRAFVSIATKIDPNTAKSGFIIKAARILHRVVGARSTKAESMRAIAEYIQHAIDCRRMAEGMTQPKDKKLLEEIAIAWEKIAALRERDVIDAKDSNRTPDGH